MIKRLKETWGIFRQYNKENHYIIVQDRTRICTSFFGTGDREDWFDLLRVYGRFTKVLSIETNTYLDQTELVITIDRPSLITIGRHTRVQGKKAKDKFWRDKYNILF